jgi:hypothetical protein
MPDAAAAGVPNKLRTVMPMTMAMIIGLSMATPGTSRSAKAAAAIAAVRARPGRTARAATPLRAGRLSETVVIEATPQRETSKMGRGRCSIKLIIQFISFEKTER